MAGLPRSAVLLAGGAIVVLLIVLPALGTPPWLVALLGLATAGALFVRSAAGRRADPDQPTDPSQAVADGRTEVERIRALADRIAKPEIQTRVTGVGDTADRILTTIKQREDATMALAFLEHYLEPFEALLTQYLRLAERGLESTAATTAKVETRDLPLFSTKLNGLDLRLQRGETVDLEAMSAGLDFDLAPVEPPPRRRR